MPEGRAPSPDRRVPVPPSLIVGVVVVLMGLSGAVGFLLAGQRETPAGSASTVAATAPTRAATAQGPAPPAHSPPAPDVAEAPSPAVSPPKAAASPPRAAALEGGAAGAPPPDQDAVPNQAAVRRYLAALDQIGGSQPSASPDLYVQQALSGDTSGIDRLITEHERRRAAILRLKPPPPAAEHHAALVRLADQGIAVMRSLKAGITTMDIGALAGLQPQAQQLQVLGDRVTVMENELRASYGG